MRTIQTTKQKNIDLFSKLVNKVPILFYKSIKNYVIFTLSTYLNNMCTNTGNVILSISIRRGRIALQFCKSILFIFTNVTLNIQLSSCVSMRHTTMLVLFVLALVFGLGDFALTPVVHQENKIKQCIKRIIDVYADDDTTVLSIYGNPTKGNFLPHTMKIPMININLNKKVYTVDYQIGKELIIIDPHDIDMMLLQDLLFWKKNKKILYRKIVFVLPSSISTFIPNAILGSWYHDIIDAIVVVYKDDSSSNITEVVISDPLHPSNRCGRIAVNMSRFSCDMIKKMPKQNFFRNYESGIIEQQKIIYKRMRKDYRRYYEEVDHSTEKVAIGVKHVYPIFVFWGGGMIVAAIVFLLEHVTHYIHNSVAKPTYLRSMMADAYNSVDLTTDRPDQVLT
ncbi:hypothetical protein FQA39_LY07749 [Lamprigera yunnana]|nr:hypothetical protein FQA39_LY07749 [Lamprigera yunnana]